MRDNSAIPESVDAYIASFPDPVRERLIELRRIIRSETPRGDGKNQLPDADVRSRRECRVLRASSGNTSDSSDVGPIEHFAASLSGYSFSKGAVQFPFDRPFPEQLIRDMVRYRRAEIEGENRRA
jgi:uncharacterized protein YdhG (YjbR/CyaY superfamily)